MNGRTYSKPILLRALPSAGKSYLTNQHPRIFKDTDDMIKELYRLSPSEGADKALKDPKFKQLFDDTLRKFSIVTNLTIPWREADIVLGYGQDYLKHIVHYATRNDLLALVGADDLQRWADDIEKFPNYVKLRASEFVSDYVSLTNGTYPIVFKQKT